MHINFEIISCPEERYGWDCSALGGFGVFFENTQHNLGYFLYSCGKNFTWLFIKFEIISIHSFSCSVVQYCDIPDELSKPDVIFDL